MTVYIARSATPAGEDRESKPAETSRISFYNYLPRLPTIRIKI
jgi:hypothetical protein